MAFDSRLVMIPVVFTAGATESAAFAVPKGSHIVGVSVGAGWVTGDITWKTTFESDGTVSAEGSAAGSPTYALLRKGSDRTAAAGKIPGAVASEIYDVDGDLFMQLKSMRRGKIVSSVTQTAGCTVTLATRGFY